MSWTITEICAVIMAGCAVFGALFDIYSTSTSSIIATTMKRRSKPPGSDPRGLHSNA